MPSFPIILCIALSLFSAVSQAQRSRRDVLKDISKLPSQIQHSALYTSTSEEDLKYVRALLEDAIYVLKFGPNYYDVKCPLYANEKYRNFMEPQMAKKKGFEFCLAIQDLEVAKYSYDMQMSFGMNAEDSLNRTKLIAGPGTRGKLEILQSTYEKYKLNMKPVEAFDRAVKGITLVPRSGLDCVERSYEFFQLKESHKGHEANPVEAMDYALAKCSR